MKELIWKCSCGQLSAGVFFVCIIIENCDKI